MAGLVRVWRTRVKVALAVLLLALLLYLGIYSTGLSHMVMGPEAGARPFSWILLGTPPGGAATLNGPLAPLTRVHGSRAHILSAIATRRNLTSARYDVVTQLFDGQQARGGGGYACCVLLNVTSSPSSHPAGLTSSQLYVTRARPLHQFHHVLFLSWLTEYFHPAPYPARQLLCPVDSAVAPAFLSLAPLLCSRYLSDYVPILSPSPAPGQLAVCGKVVYNDSLSPDWLVEWFEVQRLLGVDKVALYVMSDLPLPVTKVLRHYEAQGLALLVPFAIAGEPKRGFSYSNRSYPQFLHDEQLPIFDCKERLSGYSFVAGIDTDEIILPSEDMTLKQLLKTKLLPRHPEAAGFYFYQQYHIRDWGRSDEGKTRLTVHQYQLATLPRWESQKYVYLPSRVDDARTHEVFGKPQFPTYTVDPGVATIHQYRACPRTWADCLTMKRRPESGLLRYRAQLEAAVEASHRRLSGG